MRVTESTILVLREVLAAGSGISGVEISRNTGIMSGTLYPILHRLEKEGLLEARNEDVDPAVIGRPARILYNIRAQRAHIVKSAIAESRWATGPIVVGGNYGVA